MNNGKSGDPTQEVTHEEIKAHCDLEISFYPDSSGRKKL
jgi:hypothetical protein